MEFYTIFFFVIVVVLIVALTYVATQWRQSKVIIGEFKTKLENSKKEKNELIAEHDETTGRHSNELKQSEAKVAKLESDIRENKVKFKAEEDKLEALKEQFDKQKLDLENQFKVLSEKILTAREEALAKQNKQGVSALLKPLENQIEAFNRRVNEIHDETLKGNTSLGAEIKKVMEASAKMHDDARNLTSALKGDSQQRGAWGEAQLERTLEMSGLIDGEHYEKHSPFKDENGKQKLTDYLIKLPDNHHIIIDSKVSLVAYDKAVSSESENERAAAMDAHVKSVRAHIKDLDSKDYTNLIGVQSPNFVLMFMPIEPAYIEALKYDKELFSYGYSYNIVLVSHTTLIPILRTVANLWMLEKGSKEAREISDRAGEIYNSVCTVAERLQKLGNTLNTASNYYDETVKAISGARGLHRKVARFTQLSSKVNKKMPELVPRNLEYEVSQLDVKPLVEQVNDTLETSDEKVD